MIKILILIILVIRLIFTTRIKIIPKMNLFNNTVQEIQINVKLFKILLVMLFELLMNFPKVKRVVSSDGQLLSIV